MKIRTKFSLVMIFLLIVAMAVSVSIAIYDIKERARKDLDDYRQRELAKVKQNLKDFVDIAYERIVKNYENTEDKEFLSKYYGKRLRSVIDVAEVLLKEKLYLGSQSAFDAVGKIRYDNGTGYVWINDQTLPYPKMLMHPIIPDLNGKILNDPKYNCVKGTKANLFKTGVEVCSKQGQGFIDYYWPKPVGGRILEKTPKLSYVRMFEPLSCVLGTGVYIDDAILDAKNRAKSEIKTMRYNNGEGYFWINDTTVPYAKMLMHPIYPNLNGKALDDPKYNCVNKTNENLFNEFVRICNEKGEGFLLYPWSKPTKQGIIPDVDKLSYVRLFKPWGWIIGTGVYIDNIEASISLYKEVLIKQVNGLIRKILISICFILFLAILLCIFLSRSLTSPINDLISTMSHVKKEGLAKVEVSLKGSEEIKALGNIFNGMLFAINETVEELKKTTALKERIESELNVARDIQRSIIPSLFPAFPDREEIDIYAVLETAKAVGGDLYDFFFLNEDRICFVVGDVSGKGVPASLFMAVTRTLLRSKSTNSLSAGEIITLINKELCVDNDTCMFVTFFLCILNVKTGELEFCNAGHNPAYIIRNQKKIEKIEELHGVPLGVVEGTSYASSKINLASGDTVVCYTDGVTEAVNDKDVLFGENALEEILANHKDKDAKQITNSILSGVEQFAYGVEQADDITILVFKFLGI